MIDPFEQAVGDFIQRGQLLHKGGRVVAAVSGGPDSTALLLALNKLRADWSLELTAFHCNHQLRPASQQEEAFVRELCSRLDVDLEAVQGRVRQQAKQRGWNLEDWARRVRYRALVETARHRKAAAATGHTLDDQAETVLLKLVRGAGPEGLSAISACRLVRQAKAPEGAVAVIRPLLSARRHQVLDYLNRMNQGFCEDESNTDLSLDRNWVRLELIPLLEGRLNPNLVATLGRNAQLWGEVGDWLNAKAEELLGSCSQDGGDLLLPLQAVLEHPAIVQRTALREAVSRMCASAAFETFSLCPAPARKAIRFAHIEALLRLISQAPGRQVRLPGGLRAVREPDQLRLTLQGPTPAFCRKLVPPGELELDEVNKRLILRPCSNSSKVGQHRLWLEPSAVTVRNRRPGDRYRLNKAEPAKKLKDLMNQKRVPNALRDRLIVLESGGRIVWVEGFPPHPDSAGPAQGQKKGRRCFEILLKLQDP